MVTARVSLGVGEPELSVLDTVLGAQMSAASVHAPLLSIHALPVLPIVIYMRAYFRLRERITVTVKVPRENAER